MSKTKQEHCYGFSRVFLYDLNGCCISVLEMMWDESSYMCTYDPFNAL